MKKKEKAIDSIKSVHPASKGLKTSLMGILGNLCLAIIKAIAGIFGNSFALIADAIESAADVFTSLIVWIGLKAASKEPDENHPYGHGKAEPLAGLVVSLAMIGAAIFIAVQSIHFIVTPHAAPASFTLFVLGGVIVVKELLYRHIHNIGTEINSVAVVADAWHHRSDAITSFAAFIGIAIAVFGGEGYESADDWAALVASGIIVFNASTIFKRAFTEVMDEAPPSEISQEIRTIALGVEKVKGIDKCLVRKMGFEYFVDIHVIVDGNITVHEGHEIGHMVKRKIIQQKPTVFDVLTHIEPDF